MQYQLSFSTTLIPQLQLWHLYVLTSKLSIGDQILCLRGVRYCISQRHRVTRPEIHKRLIGVVQGNGVCIPVRLYRQMHFSCYLTSLKLHTAVVRAIRQMHDSPRIRRVTLRLFQKHLLRWKYVGHLESKERLRIQPAQLFNFS